MSLGFSSPPVVETGIGVQFQELTKFTNAHFGLFFSKICARWQDVRDVPRLQAISASLDARVHITGIRFTAHPICNRVQFRRNDKPDLMLQLQPDRIGFNWVRHEDRPYPKFDQSYRIFKEDLEDFISFLGESELGSLVPDIAEVIYMNRVESAADQSAHSLASEIFEGIDDPINGLPTPATFQINKSYSIEENQGRISFEIDAVRAGELVFRNIGRWRCDPDADNNIETAVNRAHEMAIDSFLKHTTKKARENWGQEDGL